MPDIKELRDELSDIHTTLEELEQAIDIKRKRARLAEIEKKMSAPDFWDDQETAQKLMTELSKLKKTVEDYSDLATRVKEQLGMLDLIEAEPDKSLLEEANAEFEKVRREVNSFETLRLMEGENSDRDVLLSIHAGAGGTEACDWAGMLLRMYTRWLDTNDYKYETVQHLPADEAGVKSVTLEISGYYPYGHLRCEAGVHRLVRISPFDAQSRRHTSFASVDVIPLFDVVEVDIDEKDLQIDTYRAGGPGGQHVNKTESAVRITHIPTGIVVQCQSQRSQVKNRAMAMRELIARIQRYQEAQRDAELKAILGEKGEIAWGNQIRSYVMQPYTMVKDHRTGTEESDVKKVLDGGLDKFIESYLRYRLEKRTSAQQ
ncbi:MAG: peptide chain release factor 2 [Planctomycetota bacterium]|nr:peptide chain release factor 2 [Planctomycetota bacterium]